MKTGANVPRTFAAVSGGRGGLFHFRKNDATTETWSGERDSEIALTALGVGLVGEKLARPRYPHFGSA